MHGHSKIFNLDMQTVFGGNYFLHIMIKLKLIHLAHNIDTALHHFCDKFYRFVIINSIPVH